MCTFRDLLSRKKPISPSPSKYKYDQAYVGSSAPLSINASNALRLKEQMCLNLIVL